MSPLEERRLPGHGDLLTPEEREAFEEALDELEQGDPLIVELQALKRWEDSSGLKSRQRVRIVKGPSKRREGIVMHFGQNEGLVLVGLDATATAKQEMRRFPRTFVEALGPAPEPAPSVFVQLQGKAPTLSLDALFARISSGVMSEPLQITEHVRGSKHRRG